MTKRVSKRKLDNLKEQLLKHHPDIPFGNILLDFVEILEDIAYSDEELKAIRLYEDTFPSKRWEDLSPAERIAWIERANRPQ